MVFFGVDILFSVGDGCILVNKGFHTLCQSVVLNIVNRSGVFIQTRSRKMGGRLHGADMSPNLILYR